MLWRSLIFLFFGFASATVAHSQTPVLYRMDVTYTWSAETHPAEFPAGAHMSKLFGATHSKRYSLFIDGQTPSSGLELVAENGRDTILSAEFAEAARRNRIGSVFVGSNVTALPGNISVEFEAGPDHPYLSFVSMIAPSPDWFTGASGLSLMEDGMWVDEIVVPLWAWDAGSDSGTTYLAENADTQPRESVRLLTTKHFLGSDGLHAVGRVLLTRLK